MRRMVPGFPPFLAPFVLFAVIVGCDTIDGLNKGPDKLNLGITKTANDDSVAVGSAVIFTVTVTNHGPIPADTVTAGDTLPTGLTYSSHTTTAGTVYTPTTGRWTIGTMAVGTTRTLNLTATVTAAAGTLLWNRAGVLAFQQDTVLKHDTDSLQNNADSVSVRAIAPPGTNLLAFTTQPSNAAAGATFGVAVTARTGAGATVTSFTGTVTLAIGTNPGGGTLSGTTSVSAVAGVATFSGLSINNAGTGYTLTANATGLTGATSATFNVTSSAATQLAFTTPPVTAGAGAIFGVVVAARNAAGTTATSYTGTVSMAIGTNPGGGTLSGTTSVSAVAGVATFNGLSINNAGTGYTLTASATGLTSATSAPFNIVTGSSAEPVDPGTGYIWSDSFDRYTSVVSMSATGSCPSGTPGFGLPSAESVYGRRTQPNTTSLSAACNPEGSNPGWALTTPGRGGSGVTLRSIVFSDPPPHQQQSVPWLSPWSNSGGIGTGTTPPSPAIGATQVYQWWFRTSVGGSFAPLGVKFFEWWPINPASGGDRTQLGLYINGGNTDFTGRVVGLKWHVNIYSGSEVAYQPVGPYFIDLADGNWHRFTILYKSASTNGASDGIVRAWADGTKIVDLSAAACGITPPNGTRVWCNASDLTQIRADRIHNFMFPATMNGASVGFNYDVDDLKWWVVP